jgi:uncharacterized protein (DUF1800 family)
MDNREQVQHLYRKLGFGAHPEDLAACLPQGRERAIERLLNFRDCPPTTWPTDLGALYYAEGKFVDDTLSAARGWILRMLVTRRPLEEKLALFWHGHFSVERTKVTVQPVLLDYVDRLRRYGLGSFSTLVQEVVLSPAMMIYLDLTSSYRGHPNENLARELMELFTLGEGHYSERDVLEAARALTGLGVIVMGSDFGRTNEERARRMKEYGVPIAYAYRAEDARDPGAKTILGKTMDWTPDNLIPFLARHPIAIERTCRRLWGYFVTENVPPRALQRMVKEFERSNGEIRQVLRAMVTSDEFWADEAVRTMPRSPVDQVVTRLRAFGAAEGIPTAQETASGSPAEATASLANVALVEIRRMGLDLLNPPNVAGWVWGSAFFTPGEALARLRFRPLNVLRGERALAAVERLRADANANAAAAGGLVKWLGQRFDLVLTNEDLLNERLKLAKGDAVLSTQKAFTAWLHEALHLADSAPINQMA